MRTKLVKVAVPVLAALYIFIFRGFGAAIFVSLALYLGVWQAALALSLLYIIWGVVFYLILIQSEAFEHFKDSAKNFLSKKNGKFYIWLRKRVFADGNQTTISPLLIMLVFAVESPLTGVPLIRYVYPKNKVFIGIFWIILGSIIEVVTWYYPIYGGGLSIIQAALH
jgi:hypothetical protein